MKQNKRTFSAIAEEVLNLWKTKYGKDLPWSLKYCLSYWFIVSLFNYYKYSNYIDKLYQSLRNFFKIRL